MKRHVLWSIYAAILAAILLVIGLGGLFIVTQAYGQAYADRIYPGVSVYGVNLGGLTVDEAAATLEAALPRPAALPLTLQDGQHTWQRTWADLGIQLDLQATAELAYQVGREGGAQKQIEEQLQAAISGLQLSPVIILPDPIQATAILEALAPELAVPPVNATLIINPDGVTPVPAQAGRELDVAATVAALPHAVKISPQGLTMNLLTRQVEPAIGSPGPVQGQAEQLLSRPFILTAGDFLTDFYKTWPVESTVVAGWLVVQPVEDEGGARLILTTNVEAVRAHLDVLNGQLGTDQIAIDVDKTTLAIQAAIESGENQVAVTLIHPPRTYVVQYGDTMMSIARTQGFPAWQLAQVNPGIDLENLQPGQEITLPSLDVLFPLPIVTEQRILVDISDLRLYAYQNETLVYDFPCSTGIPSSPTLPGKFQILSKEELAYASSWDLWMPHFMGVYRAGPDFTNGIHGLPTLSNGSILWGGYLGRQPISYGCIVIGLDEAAALYDWAEMGALVVIQD